MKLLWRESPQTARQLIDSLSGSVVWSPKTVKTLLNRLVNKKVIDFNLSGRVYEYYPCYKEEDCLKFERNSFLSRVYNGALKPMLAAFLEEYKLTPNEIEELKSILDEESKAKS